MLVFSINDRKRLLMGGRLLMEPSHSGAFSFRFTAQPSILDVAHVDRLVVIAIRKLQTLVDPRFDPGFDAHWAIVALDQDWKIDRLEVCLHVCAASGPPADFPLREFTNQRIPMVRCALINYQTIEIQETDVTDGLIEAVKVETTMESPRQNKTTPAGFEWWAELIDFSTGRIALLQDSVGQPGYELLMESTKQSIEMKVLQIALRLSGGRGAMQIDHATLKVEPGVELTAGKRVHADQSGNLVGSSDQRPLGVTKVDAVTHTVGSDQVEITGRYMVITPLGPAPVRATFRVRPGTRVGFFSASGEQHSATVGPDGKTLIDVTPPIDTNSAATTSIASMPPGEMPVTRGFDPESKTFKVD